MSSNLKDTLQQFLYMIVLIISFFTILMYMLSMGLGILVVFSTADGLTFSAKPYSLYPLLFVDAKITVNAGLYFIFLWWIFALCFAAAWKYRNSLFSETRRFFSSNTKRSVFQNNLLAMPIITSTLLVAIFALLILQGLGGVDTGSLPKGDPFFDFLAVSRAPLVEELAFRILPFGAFLVTYIFLIGKRTRPHFSWGQRFKACLLSVLQPEKGKEMVGLKTIGGNGWFGGIVWAEWLMIIFTALLFGVAHYLGGWGPGKISQATMSGVVFALAYLYYGIQAPILLHWFFNYYFTVFNLSSQYLGVDLLSLSWITSLLLGIVMWITIVVLGIAKISRRKPEPIPVPVPPF